MRRKRWITCLVKQPNNVETYMKTEEVGGGEKEKRKKEKKT
jgi:hypothetical protein